MRPRLGALLSPVRITVIYLAFGAGALLFSDVLLVAVVDDPVRLRQLQAIKGAVEVVLTAGLIYGLVLTYHESTEERTREVERARDRFAFLNNVLRHHVLNRMNVVQAHVNAMAEGGEGDPERLETIQRQSEAIVDLVDNVRALAHVQGDRFEPRAVELAPVVEAELDAARDRYPEAEFEASVPDEIAVEADDGLSLVVDSLLHNAVLHNDADVPRASVTVTAEGGPGFVSLRVADNGPGIPEDALDGPAAADRRGHEGLGLYVVSSIVERYGGDVHVEAAGSEADGGEAGGGEAVDGTVNGVVVVDLPRAG